MIDRILAWWYARRLRSFHRERASTPPSPIDFPVELGTTISGIRAKIASVFGCDEAVDRPVPDSPTHRERMYIIENPGGASTIISYEYRDDDGTVTAITFQDAAAVFDVQLGGIDLRAPVAAAAEALGEAAAQFPVAPVLSRSVWLHPQRGYICEWYSRDYDDIGGYHPAGQISKATVFDRERTSSHRESSALSAS